MPIYTEAELTYTIWHRYAFKLSFIIRSLHRSKFWQMAPILWGWTAIEGKAYQLLSADCWRNVLSCEQEGKTSTVNMLHWSWMFLMRVPKTSILTEFILKYDAISQHNFKSLTRSYAVGARKPWHSHEKRWQLLLVNVLLVQSNLLKKRKEILF